MRTMRWTGRTPVLTLGMWVVGGALAWGGAPGIGTAQSSVGAADGPAGAVIYLVRHAEKAVENPQDPALTPQGAARAAELARLLGDAGITRVFSTATVRTVTTAEPTARRVGVEVELYAPSGPELASFVERLLSEPGRSLVVGHSNTTPQLVQALGGDPVSPMDDADYDRIYVVVVGPDGSVTSTLLHFGAPATASGR